MLNYSISALENLTRFTYSGSQCLYTLPKFSQEKTFPTKLNAYRQQRSGTSPSDHLTQTSTCVEESGGIFWKVRSSIRLLPTFQILHGQGSGIKIQERISRRRRNCQGPHCPVLIPLLNSIIWHSPCTASITEEMKVTSNPRNESAMLPPAGPRNFQGECSMRLKTHTQNWLASRR